MALHECLAFVLDVSDYRESSSLIRVLTESEGRISLIARGLRKPKSKGTSSIAVVQPFNLVSIQFYLKEHQSLGNLNQIDLEKAWNATRENLESYALASYWFEVLKESSQPRESLSAVFKVTYDFLSYQESHPGLHLELFRQMSCLSNSLGFGLAWDICSTCGTRTFKPSHFSIKTGIVCEICIKAGRDGLPLKNLERDLIQELNGSNQELTPKVSLEVQLDLLGLVNRFMAFHLERSLKTFDFVQNSLR